MRLTGLELFALWKKSKTFPSNIMSSKKSHLLYSHDRNERRVIDLIKKHSCFV
jgi:hypothetical protein